MTAFFSPIVENALRLASYWHKGQLTSDGVFDYLIHPYAVGLILSKAGFEEDVVAAGLCHALLLATECPEQEIVAATSTRILEIIKPLFPATKYSRHHDWKSEKSILLAKITGLSWESKAVLVADRIHTLQSLIELLRGKGLEVFNQFLYTPEDSLWYEDQLYMLVTQSWSHELVDQYDELVNDYVDLLEELDKQNPGYAAKQIESVVKYDFEKPIIDRVNMVSADVTEPPGRVDSKPQISEEDLLLMERIASIDEYINEKKEKMLSLDQAKQMHEQSPDDVDGIQFKYLEKQEALMILPAALKQAIKEKQLTSPLLQDKLSLNFMVSFRVLRELKRVHVIKKADGIKPRKVQVDTAKALLKELKDYLLLKR